MPPRLLFVTPPGYGNVFPMIPAAWAARTHGCDVLIATGGRTVGAVTAAGLAAIDVTREVDLSPIYRAHKDSFFTPSDNAADSDAPLPGTSPLFTALSDAMADGTLAAAEAWRPHAIVHHPDAAAAPIVAARLGIPAVFLGIGLAQTPSVMCDGMYARMGDTCARLGIGAIPAPAAWIDVAPPSLRAAPAVPYARWPMRYVPYNGASSLLPEALAPRPARPLIAVTLGTVVPILRGLRPIRQIARAAGTLDADFIVTLGIDPVSADGAAESAADGAAAGAADRAGSAVAAGSAATDDARGAARFPPNVTAVQWQPFDRLFARCHAVIHHGGAGTVLTALTHGLPQMILPRGSDQFYNAGVLRRCGAALVMTEPALDAALLRQLLDPDGPAAVAARLRAEMLAMPAPNDVARQLAALAAGARAE